MPDAPFTDAERLATRLEQEADEWAKWTPTRWEGGAEGFLKHAALLREASRALRHAATSQPVSATVVEEFERAAVALGQAQATTGPSDALIARLDRARSRLTQPVLDRERLAKAVRRYRAMREDRSESAFLDAADRLLAAVEAALARPEETP